MADLHTEARAVYLYLTTDMTQREAAAELGVSRSSVSAWLDEHGYDSKPRADPRLENEEWLREQYRGEGLSTHDIAGDLGCTSAAVLYRLRSFGVGTRPEGGGA